MNYYTGSLNVSSDRLESLLYNPIQQNFQESLIHSSMDSDLHRTFSLPPIGNYMVEDEINSLHSDCHNTNSFSFLHVHLNCRSLFGNFDKLSSLQIFVDPSE